MKTIAAALVSSMLAAPSAASGGGMLAPFVADYDVRYGSLPVGTSRTELRRAAAPGRWVIESRSTASGMARLAASGTLTQRSEFELDDRGLRPSSYRFDDGTRSTEKDVELQFDWPSGQVRGVAEDARVEVAADHGLQDAASILPWVMARLRAGAEPGTVAMIEKDHVKHYRYTLVGRERLRTALGELDTVVYRSSRDGSNRETRFWYAPQLGYALVRAEQLRDGKRAFQTAIRRYEPGG